MRIIKYGILKGPLYKGTCEECGTEVEASYKELSGCTCSMCSMSGYDPWVLCPVCGSTSGINMTERPDEE